MALNTRDQSPKRHLKANPMKCEECFQVDEHNLRAYVEHKFKQCEIYIPPSLSSIGPVVDRIKFYGQDERLTALQSIMNRISDELLHWMRGECLQFRDVGKENEMAFFACLMPDDECDLLSLRELARDVSLAVCESNWLHSPEFSPSLNRLVSLLHPRRRKLWRLYDLNFIYSPDPAIECKHCLLLLAQFMRDTFQYTDIDPEEYDWTDEELEAKVDNYRANPVDVMSLMDSDEFGDDPPFHSALCITGDFQLNHNETVICWGHLVSNCSRCGYKTAPSPVEGFHCIACYFFMDVLNELVGSLTQMQCPKQCLSSKWNCVPQWPRRRRN